MAQLSRNARHKARQRRNISLANRQLKALHARYSNTYLSLLLVLGQKGGEVTITKGTLAQVVEGIGKGLISWQSFPTDNPDEFVIRLLTKEEVEEDPTAELGSKVQITHLPDEDEAILAQQDAEAEVEPFPGSAEAAQ